MVPQLGSPNNVFHDASPRAMSAGVGTACLDTNYDAGVPRPGNLTPGLLVITLRSLVLTPSPLRLTMYVTRFGNRWPAGVLRRDKQGPRALFVSSTLVLRLGEVTDDPPRLV
jgi:hypothetical protein